MNTDLFFEEIKVSLFNGRLSSGQRKGMEAKFDAFERHDIVDERWCAYMLATSYHETAHTMQPVEEVGKGKGKPYGEKRKYDGTHYPFPDRLYFGRGDVQLTWYENYKKMGRILGIPLLTYPELALDLDISASILVEGMTQGISNQGDFTGVALEDYFNDRVEDPVKARRIVNGLDRAQRIAGYYTQFLSALRCALVGIMALLLLPLGWMGCKPLRGVSEKMLTRTDSSAVWQLTDSLYQKEWQIGLLRMALEREREASIDFTTKCRVHEIFYDATTPIDTVTGKRAILHEIFTNNGTRYGVGTKESEVGHGEISLVEGNLTLENRSGVLVADKKTTVDSVTKEKIIASGFNWRLLLTGIIAGWVIGVAMCWRVKPRLPPR